MASPSRSPSSESLSKAAKVPTARTPSAFDFPGAFTTNPQKRHVSVGQIMKGGVAETVTGGLANVVGGMYSIVNYVNPLGSPSKAPPAGTEGRAEDPKPDSTDGKGDGSEEAKPSSTDGKGDGSKEAKPSSTDGKGDGSDDARPDDPAAKMDSPMMLQPPSAGTSVAADLDEQCLADANADNPESNRPPTPTKTSFTRMLRFPAHPVTDPSMHASSAEYKQAVQNDPVSRNVSQRTGLQFRPGAEEKRRYMRRMSKAPQLDAVPPESEGSNLRGRRSGSAQRRSSYASSPHSSQNTDDDDDEDSEPDSEIVVHEAHKLPDDEDLARFYQAAASTQRSDARAQPIEPWRFISPRMKRVKRRVLWRLFLAQEMAPAVYNEAAAIMATNASVGSSPPATSPPAARGPTGSPRSPPAHRPAVPTAGDHGDANDTASLRRRMLESSAGRGVNAKDSHSRMRAPSIAPSFDSLSTVAAGESAKHKNAIWTMEFSVCGKYLAAGGQDGVVRIWRIAPFAREQDRDKRQAESPVSAASSGSPRQHTMSGEFGGSSSQPHRSHMRQQSAAYDGDMMPFANSAPIARNAKHIRSFSMGQPIIAARAAQRQGAAAGDNPDGGEPQAASHEPSSDMPAGPLHPMHAYELLEPVPFRSYVGHSADVLSLSWSKNGFLLSASMDRTVRLWHPHRPECLCTFRHHDIVTSVAFNPRDDRLFISGSLDCRLRLWDIPARGVRHWTRLPEGQMVTSVAFTSPRGDHMVAGTYRGMCVFYSTDGLAVQGRMHARSTRGRNAKGSKITGFAFAPTGQVPMPLLQRLLGGVPAESQLLVSSNDSRLRMFLPGAREVERKYKGHANASSQAYARLSSDGRYIISGSEDHNVYVWPVAQDNAATVSTHPNSDHIRRVARGGDKPAEKKPILASLFGGKRAQHNSSQEAPPPKQEPGAAAGEWESLDGKVEEKSIYEYFPAHDAAVSQALFVPAATLQYLADHDDPILSRRKMRRTRPNGDVENTAPSSPNATFDGRGADPPPDNGDDGARVAVEDMTAIIVSADTTGTIRVFRKDINLRRPSPANRSRTSLLRTKESMGSLRRAITRDRLDAGDYDGSHLSREASEPDHPPSLAARPSFWNRLGRRASQKSQKHQSMAFTSTQSAAPVDRSPLRPRAPSAGPEPVAATPLSAIAESPAVSTSSQQQASAPAAACEHCGHTRFKDFSVAPSSPTSASTQMWLSVCENCKHVRNLPASLDTVP
ncbi:hypothetical protein GGF46_001821 [Coemansia sp. RSA 552]|nr:hypothetical protein GGF46_001821 [Coemansia sp. RSA 552]